MNIPISTGILLSPFFFLSNVRSFHAITKTNAIPIDILLKAKLNGISVTRTIAIGVKTINEAIRYNIQFKLPFFMYNIKSNLLILILCHSLRYIYSITRHFIYNK